MYLYMQFLYRGGLRASSGKIRGTPYLFVSWSPPRFYPFDSRRGPGSRVLLHPKYREPPYPVVAGSDKDDVVRLDQITHDLGDLVGGVVTCAVSVVPEDVHLKIEAGVGGVHLDRGKEKMVR